MTYLEWGNGPEGVLKSGSPKSYKPIDHSCSGTHGDLGIPNSKTPPAYHSCEITRFTEYPVMEKIIRIWDDVA